LDEIQKNKTHIITVYDNEFDEFENMPQVAHSDKYNKNRKNCIGVLTLEDIIE